MHLLEKGRCNDMDHTIVHKALEIAVKLKTILRNPTHKGERPKIRPYMGSLHSTSAVRCFYVGADDGICFLPLAALRFALRHPAAAKPGR